MKKRVEDYYLTVGELKEILADAPDDAPVFIERIKDIYFERHGWDILKIGHNGEHEFTRAWSSHYMDDYKAVIINAHF